MSNAQFTPGPWKIRNERIVEHQYIDGRVVKNCIELDIQSDPANTHITSIQKVVRLKENAIANANLIAAAPDMYEALEAASKYLMSSPGPDKLREKIRAALNKANGK